MTTLKIADGTQYQIAAAKEQHKRKLELFKEKRFAERILKSKIINISSGSDRFH